MRWTGYDNDPTWYHITIFKKCPKLLEKFHKEYPSLPGPPIRLADWMTAFDKDTPDLDHPVENFPVAAAPVQLAQRQRRGAYRP